MRAASSLVLRSPTRFSDARSRSHRACSSLELLLLRAELLAQRREALLRRVVLLLLERELLELEAVDVAAQLVDLERRRVDLHAQARRGLVDEVDRLVGQLPARDVAIAESDAAATSAASAIATLWCAS